MLNIFGSLSPMMMMINVSVVDIRLARVIQALRLSLVVMVDDAVVNSVAPRYCGRDQARLAVLMVGTVPISTHPVDALFDLLALRVNVSLEL